MTKRLSWLTRIERAEKRGKFLPIELGLASMWRTCAIGEQHGYPWACALTDDEERLGVAFCRAVETDDLTKARTIYEEIKALPPVTT